MTRRQRWLLDFDAAPMRVVLRVCWLLRRGLKWLAVPLGINDRLIECCQVCGIQQPLIWHAPHWIWESVAGSRQPGGDRGGEWAPGVLCPRCFNQKAEALGLVLVWVPMRHGDDIPFLGGIP